MNERLALCSSSFRVPRSPFLILLLLLCPAVVCAQASQTNGQPENACPKTFAAEEAEEDYAIATGTHLRRFRSLGVARGSRRVASIPDADAPRFLSLEQLRDVLFNSFEEGTAVLFYSEDDGFFRAWLIDREGIQAFHRARQSRVQMESAIAGLRESLDVEELAVRRLPPRLRPTKRAVRSGPHPKALLPSRLAALTNLLLPGDITCALRRVRHLVIVPVFDLGTVPFAALRPFGQSASLIDLMSVTIAPSLPDIIRRSDTSWSAQFQQPLLVGNPYLKPSAGWESLNNAEREAQYVGRMFKAKPLIGRQATREAILSRAKEADFLYFATHGAADTAQPLEGGFLVFSGAHGAESLWTAREIQRTHLKARLAVLSACQTGLGKTHDAGIIGLARAFHLAGVPRVVMSLWSVYDDATSDLMQAFARHLSTSAPAEALRQAMLEVRKRRPDPAEWASFVIFGTPQ